MVQIQEITSAEMAVFKKKMKMLEKFKGKNTELITLYIPEGTDRSSVMNQLTEEISQSSNIKSPQTRKNVQGALRKITTFLKKINFDIPRRGLVVFAGNVSEVEGRSDIKLFTINPVKDLKVKLYWCDSTFHLVHLKEMLAPNAYFGLIAIDKSEATIAQLFGKKFEILYHTTSTVPGKTRAGGQCLTPETQVILSNGEIKNIEQIKENDLIKSINFKTGQTVDSKVTKKWQTTKETITIHTQNPKFEISCSPDHVFFVWNNGAILEKPTSELTTKDVLLFNETIKITPKEVALTSNLYNKYSLTQRGQAVLLQARQSQELTQKQLAKEISLSQTEISLMGLGKRNCQRKTIQSVCKGLHLNSEKFIQEHCKHTDSQVLPIKLDSLLAQLMGYFEGDGSFEKERINFSESDLELANFYSQLANNLFNSNSSTTYRQNKGYYQTRIYGKQIVNFIKHNFPEINTALDSSIPEKILSSNNIILASFLKGIYDAEGYVSNKGIELGINNRKLAQQIQLCLLRFGIISSLSEYDNNKNPYSDNPRHTVTITGKYSLELFKNKINFNSKNKSQELDKVISKKSNKDKSRQILMGGVYIKSLLLETNTLKKFYPVNMYLNGKRKISKEIFKKQIIDKANARAQKELQKTYDYKLLPTEIISITKSNKQAMIDISTENQNFIANGLIVHNSSQRFERLREEAAQAFFKKISERVNDYFLPYGEKMKGLIIGGPGVTKRYFINRDLIHHELQKKIIGTVDISYTDESGIREIVQKSEEILKDTELMKERLILDKFLGEIAKDGLATYGQAEVEKVLKDGKVEKLLISEDIEWIVVEKLCGHCDKTEIEIFKDPDTYEASKVKCSCGNDVEILEEIDYLDYLVEKAKSTGAEVNVISTETGEGKQFFDGFGGIGALLRYK